MTQLNPGRTGAKRQSWEKYNPRELLKDAIRSNPRASEAEISEVVWESVKNEKGYLWPLYEYWFANNYKRFFVEEVSDYESVGHTSIKTREVPERNGSRQEFKNIKEKLKSILMDYMLSNGKRLRDATFQDCKIDGGWLKEVAKQGRPNEVVGKKLTEKDLQCLMTRSKK